MDGTIENIDITDGILLTTSEFVSQEDIEMTTTHDDLSLFQISFCIDGNMEWSYINNEVVHQFQIAAQQSQVRYGTFKECRSKISGNRKYKGISIALDEKIFEQIFTCIKIRGALYDTRKTAPVRVYTYTPNISKILSEILACHFCDEMKKIYLQGKIFELIAVYCDEVICKSPTNDFGIRISVEDYNALLKAREFIGENFAHPLTIPIVCEVIFLMSFLLYLQHPKEALRLGVWFAFLVGLYALLNESNAPQIIVQPVFLLRKLSPLLGVMVLSLKALTVSELFMGLQIYNFNMMPPRR